VHLAHQPGAVSHAAGGHKLACIELARDGAEAEATRAVSRPNPAPSVCRVDADTCASGVDPEKHNIYDSCTPPEAAFVCGCCQNSKCFARDPPVPDTVADPPPVAAAATACTRAGFQLHHQLQAAAVAGQLWPVSQTVAIVLYAHGFHTTKRSVVCMCSQWHGQLQQWRS
jgi:hypothetical protein